MNPNSPLRAVIAKLARRIGLRYSLPPPQITEYQDRLSRSAPTQGGRRLHGELAHKKLGQPLVSIITVVRNNPHTLQAAIDSVKAQNYPNIEHILVDGASTDNTLDVIRANEDHTAIWISESDKGIYDAINKGIALARGELIGILNADDYYTPDQIMFAVETILSTNADWAFGDIIMHGWQGKSVRIGADPLYARLIRKTMPSLHQINSLARRQVFEDYGLFRTDYRIAGDYDWYLRMTIGGAIGHYDERILSHMNSGGASTTMQRKAIVEGFLVSIRNGYPLLLAARHWGLRWIYPNGAPPYVGQSIARIRHIKSRLVSLLKGPRSSQPSAFLAGAASSPSEVDVAKLQRAFLDARHLGRALDDATLLRLADLGRDYRSFHVLGNSIGVRQAETMLGLASVRSHDGINDCELIVSALSDFPAGAGRLPNGVTLVLVPGHHPDGP